MKDNSQRDIELNKIEHILFDLGGVLLNIDYQLTEDAFVSLGLSQFNELYSQAKQAGLFDEFETGRSSTQVFLKKLTSFFPFEVSNEKLRKAWNAMLLDFPESRLDMLEKLGNQYGVYLLSNTNEIHFEAFQESFESAHKRSLSDFFIKDYYSHLIGHRKPNPEVFEFIMAEQGISANNILFIDDSPQHLEGATKLGIQTLYLEQGKEVQDLLRSVGVLA